MMTIKTIVATAILAGATLCAASPAFAWFNDGRPEMDNFAMESQLQGYLAGGPAPSFSHETSVGTLGGVIGGGGHHVNGYGHSSQLFGGPSHMRGRDYTSDRDVNPNGGFWSMMDKMSARARKSSERAVAFARKHPAQAARNDAEHFAKERGGEIYGIDRGRFGTPSGAPDSQATDTGAHLAPFHYEGVVTPKNFRSTALRGATAPKPKAPAPTRNWAI